VFLKSTWHALWLVIPVLDEFKVTGQTLDGIRWNKRDPTGNKRQQEPRSWAFKMVSSSFLLYTFKGKQFNWDAFFIMLANA
jgi:hypothetical protein